MDGARNGTFCFAPPPGPCGGAKRSNIIKHHKISITKSVSKIFKPNLVCFLTNERYKTYQTGFHLAAWVMRKAWDLGVPWGVKNKFSEIQPDLVCELLT